MTRAGYTSSLFIVIWTLCVIQDRSKVMDKILITGCGDIGRRIAKEIRDKEDNDCTIYGLTRNSDTASELESRGIRPIVANMDKPGSLINLPSQGATIFHLAPPPSDSQGEDKTRDPRFRALLDAFDNCGIPEKIILLSTTAVYGDCHGEWIDETADVNPQTDRGRRRLDGEQVLREWAETRNVAYIIIRVSGIYGAGRLPIERLKKGLPILREDQAPYSNRIHQDDLAMVCVAAAKSAPSGAIYNACDGHPSTMSHYFKAIARALNLPMPPEIDRQQAEKELSAGMLSYLRESRRLSNQKMLKELNISLLYPDLDSGLKSISESA